MRRNKFVFAATLLLLVILFANGLYLLAEYGSYKLAPLPEPIRYDTGTNKPARWYRPPENGDSGTIPVNLLVLGLDEEETRSDVILLFNFEPSHSKLNILSVARDTRVYVDGKYAKINALYAKGGEELLAEEVSEITGLPVHYYLTMNFKGFRKIIDTLGGIRFYVPFRMRYDDPTQNLHIRLEKGMQLLDGKKAEQLVRYRKGNTKRQGYTDGDIGRIKMQQEFIKAFISQKFTLSYLSKVNNIFGILKEYVGTNIKITDAAYYLKSAGQIRENGIKNFTLPGESRIIGDAWYYLCNQDETDKLVREHFYR